ncbi:unnamed protein product, partial [Porites lobata]
LPDAHCFADDTQLYLSFKPLGNTAQADAIQAMEKCIDAVRKWMIQDRLMINDDKTEFLLVGTRQQLDKLDSCSITILLLTFKCIYGLAPTYLSDLISIKSNSLYNLRSTGKLLLDHPKGKMLTTLGARSFSAAAPKLWNELPVELRQATSLNSFKSRLKTYLFKKYFYSL